MQEISWSPSRMTVASPGVLVIAIVWGVGLDRLGSMEGRVVSRGSAEKMPGSSLRFGTEGGVGLGLLFVTSCSGLTDVCWRTGRVGLLSSCVELSGAEPCGCQTISANKAPPIMIASRNGDHLDFRSTVCSRVAIPARGALGGKVG